MLFVNIIVCFGIIGVTDAFPSTTYAVKERHTVPRSWTKIGPSSKRDTIHLQIGLKQQNDGIIEQKLLENSNPKHENYGKHLSRDEVIAIITPSEDTLHLVQSWLDDHGIKDYFHNTAKDMIHCEVAIEKAEQLLQTSYSTYRHKDGSELNRAPEWSLPQHLHEHIDIIQPTTSFFHPKKEVVSDSSAWHPVTWWDKSGQQDYPKAWAGSSGGGYGSPYGGQGGPVTKPQGALGQPVPQQSGQGGQAGGSQQQQQQGHGRPDVSNVCDLNMTTPQCLRILYGTIDYQPQVPNKNGIATANYLNETAFRTDISAFMQRFRPDAGNAGSEFQSIQIAGGDDTQDFLSAEKEQEGTNKEANLDAQQAIAMTYPTMFTAYHTGGKPPFNPSASTPENTNEPYSMWLDYVLQQQALPQVITTSYGDDEQTVPRSYAERVCKGFAQLGARGITLIFSSGDNGVGQDGACVSNDGNNTPGFLANFPGSCPWVTTVGATENYQPEVAVSRFASGGGFSNYFNRPDYQSEVVTTYIQSLNGQYKGMFNPEGRGYPDVAAQGNHLALLWNNQISTIGGTSASAPIFAGVVALINDALIAQGKPPLGFLNPFLYSTAYSTFTDVTSGSAFGCESAGFPAQQGWDAVTGFGTPNFKHLLDAAMQTSVGDQGGQELDHAAQREGSRTW